MCRRKSQQKFDSTVGQCKYRLFSPTSVGKKLGDRASRYSHTPEKDSAAVLIAYVVRTPKGKIRLRKIAIRLRGKKELDVTELPSMDPRFVFESDYKVRKAAHDETRKSAQFSRFSDSTARVVYEAS